MKKTKIIGMCLVALILIGLIIYASVLQFEDSHLRVEGIRVRATNGLIVDGCLEESATVAYCEKNIEVNGENQKLVFQMKDFKENGYPNTIVASINGHEFYKAENLELETNGSIDYKIFLNFYVMGDKYIIFTLTDGTNGRATTLYGIDMEGNIILKEYDIDDEDMVIKDYTDFITYEDNVIQIYATRVVQDINYKEENVCNAKSSEIVEAYYTFTYKDDEFIKKQTQTITAEQFIENKGI